jgi:DNA-binding transcriptional ArsR family regulator
MQSGFAIAHPPPHLFYSLDTVRRTLVALLQMQAQRVKPLPVLWRGSAKVFAALGDEHRQRILLMCRRRLEIRLQDVFAVLPLSRTAIVHHIGVLREAQLLAAEKRGGEVYLQLNIATLGRAAKVALRLGSR